MAQLHNARLPRESASRPARQLRQPRIEWRPAMPLTYVTVTGGERERNDFPCKPSRPPSTPSDEQIDPAPRTYRSSATGHPLAPFSVGCAYWTIHKRQAIAGNGADGLTGVTAVRLDGASRRPEGDSFGIAANPDSPGAILVGLRNGTSTPRWIASSPAAEPGTRMLVVSRVPVEGIDSVFGGPRNLAKVIWLPISSPAHCGCETSNRASSGRTCTCLCSVSVASS